MIFTALCNLKMTPRILSYFKNSDEEIVVVESPKGLNLSPIIEYDKIDLHSFSESQD